MFSGPPPPILYSGFLALAIAGAAFWLCEVAGRAHDATPARVRSLRILSSVLCVAMALLFPAYFLVEVAALDRMIFAVSELLEVVILALLVAILILVALQHGRATRP